ncbi:MAG: hypothetical protein WKF94_16900 [Solirubrobacteraceae bacterium]
MAVADADDQLAWEERTRPRAAAIAALGGLLGVVGALILYYRVSVSDAPSSLLLDSLQNLERPGPIGEQPTARTATFQYEDDNLGFALGWRVMVSLGLLGTGLVLSYLGTCTRARRPKLARFALPAPAVGGALLGASILTLYLAQQQLTGNVLDGDGTVDAATQSPSSGDVGSGLLILGSLTFAVGGALVALNAMRAGLLTKTMGILGMFAALSPMLLGPIQFPPLLPLWTIFLVPLLLGRWMGGQPPAWVTGREEPWPTAAELREERMRAKGKLAEPDPVAVETAARATREVPHPSSKKRKRKRRT